MKTSRMLNQNGSDHQVILETERLILRQLDLTDSDFIITLLNTPGWLKFIGDRNVKSEQQAKDYLLNGPIKSYAENGFGLSLVALKHNNTPVGMCGLLKRDYLELPDIGFAFLEDFTGNGYAYEIARATLEHANHSLNLTQIMAITLPSNGRSIKLLEKLGLKFHQNIVLPGGSEALMVFIQ